MFGYGIYKKKDVEGVIDELVNQAKEALDIAAKYVEDSRRFVHILNDVATLPEYAQDEKSRALIMEVADRWINNLTHEEYVAKEERIGASVREVIEYLTEEFSEKEAE